ncbi:MAG: NAD-dependent epimerase/dehydratase family protein [Acidimicrobiales bacterium]
MRDVSQTICPQPFVTVVPSNLYGPNDNFDVADGGVIPSLVRRFHEAKLAGEPEVVVWGSGTVRREFLLSTTSLRRASP